MQIIHLNSTENIIAGGYNAGDTVVCLCDCTDGSFAPLLPDAPGIHDVIFYFKKTDSSVNTVTITPINTQTIDGESTVVLDLQNAGISIASDNSNWVILPNQIKFTGTIGCGAITSTGSITGNSLITASNIGIVADLDLIQLTANLLTVNGAITSTGYVDTKEYYYIDGNKFMSRDGTNCLFVGVSAGAGNTGNHVVSFGDESGGGTGSTNTGDDNLFIGYLSGRSNTSGQQNAFLGTYTGRTNTTGGYNLFLATNAGLTNLSGSGNVALGFDSLYTNSTGSYSVAIGYQAGRLYAGDGGTFIGYLAGTAATGVENTFIGNRAGVLNTTGRDNTFIGMFAGRSNLTGRYITCVGRYAGQSTTVNFGTFIGRAAGYYASSGINNTMVGGNAGYYQGTGANNTFLGYAAGQGSGAHNSSNNVFVGYQSGFDNATGGDGNAALGYQSAFNVTTGDDNTLIGMQTGYTQTTAARNIFLGRQSGYYETGSDTLMIDNRARTNEATHRLGALVYGLFNATVEDQEFILNASLHLKEISAANTDRAGYGQVWCKNNGGTTEFWVTEDDGTDHQLAYV